MDNGKTGNKKDKLEPFPVFGLRDHIIAYSAATIFEGAKALLYYSITYELYNAFLK